MRASQHRRLQRNPTRRIFDVFLPQENPNSDNSNLPIYRHILYSMAQDELQRGPRYYSLLPYLCRSSSLSWHSFFFVVVQGDTIGGFFTRL